jgi:hypothetical protein
MSNTPPGVAQTWSSYPAPQAYITWTDSSGTTNWFTFDLVESENWDTGADITEHPVEQGANIADHVRVKLDKCELKIFSTNEPINGNAFDQAEIANVPIATDTPSWVPGDGLIIIPQWENNIALRALAGSLVGLVGGLSGTGGKIAGLAIVEAADLLVPGEQILLPVQTDAGLLPPAPVQMSATVQQYATPTDYVEATHAQMIALKNAAQIVQVFGTKQVNFSMVVETASFMRDVDSGTGEVLTIGFKEIRVVSTQVVTAPIPHLSAGGGKPPVSHGAQTPEPVTSAKLVSAAFSLVKK